jgi:hypothetical protein
MARLGLFVFTVRKLAKQWDGVGESAVGRCGAGKHWKYGSRENQRSEMAVRLAWSE